MARKPIVGDWYDHPEYYDLSVSEDTPAEAAFIEAACRKYGVFPTRRLLEPACGSGRLVVAMAASGYEVTGLDLNDKALSFLRKRLRRRKLTAEVLRADMTDFTLAQPVDAAFCLLNSFRHLLTEAAAKSHLEAVARSLRPGGIYILGLHLVPPDAYDDAIERWRTRRGATQISTDLRVTASDRRRRVETLQVSLLCAAARSSGDSAASSISACTLPPNSAGSCVVCRRSSFAMSTISGMKSTSHWN